MTFELLPPDYEPSHPQEQYTDYGEPCDYCGGKVVSTGGSGYYNGSYQCYTMYLKCENCGDYEVECV